MRSITLTSEEFDALLRIFSILSESCNDVDMREGHIRQRSNDRLAIFDFDLSPLFQDLSFPILKLKDKLSMLKCFKGHSVTIDVEENDYYRVYDEFSTIRFRIMDSQYIDNSYIDDEELASMFIIQEDDLVLETDLNSTITNRIKAIDSIFSLRDIYVQFENDMASMVATSESKENEINFLSNMPVEQQISGWTNITVTPFVIDHDDEIKFKMYALNDDAFISKIDTKLDNVNLTIYTRSPFTSEEDEEED